MRDGVKSTKLYGVTGFKTYFNFKKDFIKDEWNDRIYNDEVRTDRIPLSQLRKEAGCTWVKSPWIAHVVEAPISTIVKKFKISSDDKRLIKITKTAKGVSADYGENISDDFKYGCYSEIEDRANGKIMTLVDGLDYWVKGPENKNYSYDTMYDFLEYNDLPDVANTKSDFHFWKDQLRELGIYRTMLANHAKKGNSKYKIQGAELTEDQKAQLQSSEDKSFVQLTAGQDVNPMIHAPIDQSIFQAEQVARGDIQLISKNAPRQSGQEKTATEVKAVEAAAMEVSSENLERLEEVMASIASKWNALMQANYTVSRIVSLTDMSEAEYLGYVNKLGDKIQGSHKKPFLKVSGEDFSTDVVAAVKAGSTQADNDQNRINKFMGFVKFVGSLPGAAAAIDPEELIKEATEVFDVRNLNLLKQKENPVAESKLLNNGTFIAAKLNENHDEHLMIHEKESNGNAQNALHIMMHKEFKRQIEQIKQAQVSSQIGKVEMAPTGQSFVGANQQMPSPLAAQPAPMAAVPRMPLTPKIGVM